MYASFIGGILILLFIVLFCFRSPSQKAKSPSITLDKRAYLNQANDFANNKEFEKAIEAYKKAYELDPDDNYATDQISIIYEREFHDNAKAEYWKNKSFEVTSNKVSSDFGASAKAYEERAERKKQRQEMGM